MKDIAEFIDNPNVEVRIGYYSHLMVSSFQLQMIREEIAMKQHCQDEQDKHDLLMHAMKLRYQPGERVANTLWVFMVPFVVLFTFLLAFFLR